MSSISMLETFDTQMVDFEGDPDIAMVGSSSDNWIQSDSRMDEDAYNYGQYIQQDQVNEIEMTVYDETAEFEMADGEALSSVQPEILDTELYDASNMPSPIPVQTTEPHSMAFDAIRTTGDGVTPNLGLYGNIIDESSSLAGVSLDNNNFIQSSSVETISSHYVDDTQDLDNTSKSQTNVIHDTTELKTADILYPDQAFDGISRTSEHGDVANGVALHESHEDEIIDNHDREPEIGEGKFDQQAAVTEDNHEVTDDVPENAQVQPELGENVQSELLSSEKENIETQLDGESALEENRSNNQSLAAPEEVYLEAPPPILLSLRLSSSDGEQPEFAIFTAPEIQPVEDGADKEGTTSASEEPLLLLQHRPMLYYEPISAVFEAFRHEEYFSHLEDLMEAEMALNAYDLQLTVSEDNVYAREISLHDLNAMHVGIGLTGSLRFALQSVFPRFITRYNILREQISRLVTTHPAEDEEVDNETVREEEVNDYEYNSENQNQNQNNGEAIGNVSRTGDEHPETSLEDNGNSNVVEPLQEVEVGEKDDYDNEHGINTETKGNGNNTDGDEETAVEVPTSTVSRTVSNPIDNTNTSTEQTHDTYDTTHIINDLSVPDLPEDDDWTEYDGEAEHYEQGEEAYEEVVVHNEPGIVDNAKNMNGIKSSGYNSFLEVAENTDTATSADIENSVKLSTADDDIESSDVDHQQSTLENDDESTAAIVVLQDEHVTDKFSYDQLGNFEGEDEDAEGSLDPDEFLQEDALDESDLASRAALLESEQFLETLSQEENSIHEHTETEIPESNVNQISSSEFESSVKTTTHNYNSADKQRMPSRKRSLDDAELGNEIEGLSRQSSEGNLKRARMVEKL